MSEKEPHLITPSESQKIVVDGYQFSVEIYRLDGETGWTLEVVDHKGASHIWSEEFTSDQEARRAAVKTLEDEVPLEFMSQDSTTPIL